MGRHEKGTALSSPYPDDKLSNEGPFDIKTLPPLDVRHFRGRESELQRIAEYLDDPSVRAIRVSGPSGSGKTALLSKLHTDMNLGATEIASVDVACIYWQDCVDCDRLERTLQTIRDKWSIKHFFNTHHSVPQLLLLDNFECALERNGALHAAVDRFFRWFFNSPHELRLIIISKEAVPLGHDGQAATRTVDLLGLPVNEAVDFLRALDCEDVRGLRSADDGVLRQLSSRCFGLPGALQRIAEVLDLAPRPDVETLLHDDAFFTERVLDDLLSQHYRELSRNERLVLIAISVFRVSVDETAIKYLLSCFGHRIQLDAALASLTRRRVVVSDGLLYRPTDLAKQWASTRVSELQRRHFLLRRTATRLLAHQHIAEYYRRRSPADNGQLNRQQYSNRLQEYEHLLMAEQYDAAYRVLETFSFSYLWLWGYYDRVVELHERVEGRLRDPLFQELNIGNLGFAYCGVGRYEKAIDFSHAALERAQTGKTSRALSTTQRSRSSRWLGNLGLAYVSIGECDFAERQLESALAIDLELDDAEGTGIHLSDLALVHRTRGRLDLASQLSIDGLQSSEVAGDQRVQCNHYVNLGECAWLRGELTDSEAFFQNGMSVAEQCNCSVAKFDNLAGLIRCALAKQEYEAALALGRSVGFANCWQDELALWLGIAYAGVGDSDKAGEAFERVLSWWDELLQRSGRNIDALYGRIVALTALRSAEVQCATAHAVQVCSEKGIRRSVAKHIRLLAHADSTVDGQTPIRLLEE